MSMIRPTNPPSRPGYRITPTILNKWTELANADRDWETFYGSADDPSVSSEDYYAKKEQELLDTINRVPFTSEAASRGTALNELVDCIVDKRKQREDMIVERVHRPMGSSVVYDEVPGGELFALQVGLDGFSFLFDIGLVRSLADYFKGAICQHRCEAVMDTEFGPVILYGDADYILRDVVYDLKTTSKYSAYGKFEEGWQKVLYPWALTESGDMEGITGFEYTIIPLSGGTSTSPLITGEIMTEWYDYSHGVATRRLRQVLEAFLPWLEDHRSYIFHPRIFNQE